MVKQRPASFESQRQGAAKMAKGAIKGLKLRPDKENIFPEGSEGRGELVPLMFFQSTLGPPLRLGKAWEDLRAH